MKAMIFAAGLGTRFKPWTDKHPKALEIVDALPRNPAGKVLKTELRLRYGAHRDSEKHSAPKDSAI